MAKCFYAVYLMPTVAYAECHKLALYVGFHYAECDYAEYDYADYHYAECHYAECQNAECLIR